MRKGEINSRQLIGQNEVDMARVCTGILESIKKNIHGWVCRAFSAYAKWILIIRFMTAVCSATSSLVP